MFLRTYLFLAWLTVCGHIWFSSDDGNGLFDTHCVDHSFAEPARETRSELVGRKRRVRDGRVAVSKFFVEEELEEFEDEIVGAENNEELDDDNDRKEQDKEEEGGGRDVTLKHCNQLVPRNVAYLLL